MGPLSLSAGNIFDANSGAMHLDLTIDELIVKLDVDSSDSGKGDMSVMDLKSILKGAHREEDKAKVQQKGKAPPKKSQ